MNNAATQPIDESINELLELTATELDIDKELDTRLTASYHDLGNWLKVDNANRFSTDSELYSQGSKRLGTLTAPVETDADCDVDVVYRRDLQRTSITQRELKESAGEQLSRYIGDRGRRGLEVPAIAEGSRCWTLLFDGYHLDVLPALPDDGNWTGGDADPDAIIITDRNLREWQCSNPKAYARWFKKRMEVALQEGRRILAKVAGVEVERIPEHDVKTPLQVAVQLLKRHRDLFYEGHPDDKPISIIITTLAAHSYSNETNVLTAIRGIANSMHRYIQVRDGVQWVVNPTNRHENFADKWEEYPERREMFGDWLALLRTHLNEAENQQGIDKVASVLSRSFGKQTVDRALIQYGNRKLAARTSGTLRASSAGVLGSIGTPIPPHTFHGDER